MSAAPDDQADANAVRETPAAALRRLMADANVSQGQIVKRATAAGHKITQSAVSQILSGAQALTLQSAQALAAALDVSPTLFLPELAGMADTASAREEAPAFDGVTLVPLIKLTPSPLNPRRIFDVLFKEALTDLVLFARGGDPSASLIDSVDGLIAHAELSPATQEALRDIAGLAETIADKGLLQNLVARPDAEQPLLWIVAGERRYWAIELLRRVDRMPQSLHAGVPCRVVDIDDGEHLALAIVENLQRKDVAPLEEAAAFVRLHELDPQAWTTSAIAKRIGVTQRHVQLRMALVTKLSDDAKDALSRGRINLAQARALTAAVPETQALLLRDIEAGYIADAADVAAALAKANIPLSRAIFDPADYTGPVHVDDKTGEPYAQDAAMFKSLQRRAVDRHVQILRESNVGVVKLILDSDTWAPDTHWAIMDRIYPAASPLPPYAQTAAVIVLTRDATVRIYEHLMKVNDPPPLKPAAGAAKAAAAAPVDPVEAVSRNRRIVANQAKTRALQTALFAAPRVLHEAFCLAMITDGTAMAVQPAPVAVLAVVSPVVSDVLDGFAKRLSPSIIWAGDHLRTVTPLADVDRDAVAQALAKLHQVELEDLMHALMACRVVSCRQTPDGIGDDRQTLDMVDRLEIDMSRWQIDAAYLATLGKPQIEDLYYDLGCNRYVKPAPFFARTIEEQRATLLDLVETHDLRHVPPELEFGGRAAIEARIAAAAEKHRRPVQADLIAAIGAPAPAGQGRA